jgi:hypothetical protein
MNTIARVSFLAFSVIGALGLVSDDADANISSCSGINFHAFQPSQQQYLVRASGSWGALGNTAPSGTSVSVVGEIAYNGNTPVSVAVLGEGGNLGGGNEIDCQAVVTNNIGNAFWSGPDVPATGAYSWQTLPLSNPGSNPPDPANTSLLVFCNFETGAEIGLAYQ